MEKRITIFTPTYNRAHLLHNCYQSLLNQGNQSFKWLIIDDGSTDDTRDVVQKWITDNLIEIQYVYKENGGLHTGYNKAIECLDTELAVCIDSDDWLAEDAVQRILDFWDRNQSKQYAGIIGLDFDPEMHVIGGYLPECKSVNPVLLLASKQKGDKKYVVRSELYKSVAPMPVFDHEKNFNPHYLILKLSRNYEFLIMNEPLCIVDYQSDGMSANIFKQYLDSPKSFAELRRLIMSLPSTPFLYLCKTTIHYVSSNIIAGQYHYLKESPKKLLTILLTPFGLVLSRYIKRNHQKVIQMRKEE